MIHYAFLTVFIIAAILDLGLGDSSIIFMTPIFIVTSPILIGLFGVDLYYRLFRVCGIENSNIIFIIMFIVFYGGILFIVFSIIYYMVVTLVQYDYIFFSTMSLLLMFNKWRTAQAIKKEKERKERERIHLEKWREEIKRKDEERIKNYKSDDHTGILIVSGILFGIVYIAEKFGSSKNRK
jgi:hypothetical protein